ncbi:hypothetical protein, partial [Amycolatopsis cihanbeyliensis]
MNTIAQIRPTPFDVLVHGDPAHRIGAILHIVGRAPEPNAPRDHIADHLDKLPALHCVLRSTLVHDCGDRGYRECGPAVDT